MLDAMRRGAQTWIAKILFALLILSFGIFWNVSDVITGIGRGSLAKVGETGISVDSFQRAFQNRISELSRNSGQRISTEMALKFGLDRQVLDGLIGQTALRSQAENLGIALSDETIAEELKRVPQFQGVDGKFSRLAFDSFLRQIGMGEGTFIALTRNETLARIVADSLMGAVVTPKPFLEQRNAYLNETRTIDHFTIDKAKIPAIADPDEGLLKERYEQNTGSHMSDEMRKVNIIILALDDLKKEVSVSDEEIKQSYEETKASYDKPERRRVQQIAFKDKAAAEEARKALVDGTKNFMDVAKEVGAKESDVNLGMLAKAQIIDPAVADAAFLLERDAISEVIDGKFSTVIVRAIEIEEGKTSTFEEVKDKVRDRLAGKKATTLIQDRADLVEEARNAGKTFKEISETQKLQYYDVETSQKNKTADGKTALDISEATTIINAAFAAEQGNENDPVELPSTAYAWYNVVSVTPPQQRTYEAVKDEVKAAYIAAETRKKATEMASDYVERLNKGEDIAKLAEEAGSKAETSDTQKRNMSPPGLTQDAMRQAFALAIDAAGSAPTADSSSRIVFQVKGITPAAVPNDKEEAALEQDLRSALGGEQLSTYVKALEAELGVSIDEETLKRITGADSL